MGLLLFLDSFSRSPAHGQRSPPPPPAAGAGAGGGSWDNNLARYIYFFCGRKKGARILALALGNKSKRRVASDARPGSGGTFSRGFCNGHVKQGGRRIILYKKDSTKTPNYFSPIFSYDIFSYAVYLIPQARLWQQGWLSFFGISVNKRAVASKRSQATQATASGRKWS